MKNGKATERDELKVSKITVVVLGLVAIALGILFEKQNIAFMVGLAFSIAASCNFPIIILSMYWSRLTTRGAMIGGWLGLLTAASSARRSGCRSSGKRFTLGAVLDVRGLCRHLAVLSPARSQNPGSVCPFANRAVYRTSNQKP